MTAATSSAATITADELLRLPRDGRRYERIAGDLSSMSPAGWRHGSIGSRIVALVSTFVAANELGLTFGSESGFLVHRSPDTVLAPDLAFVRRDHLPNPLPEEAYWPGAPDLVAEITPPSDTFEAIHRKVLLWLAAGAAMIWLIDPSCAPRPLIDREPVSARSPRRTSCRATTRCQGFTARSARFFPR